MQTAVEPSPASSSFAGVLAALTGGRIKPSSNWEDDLERDLEPDVATLSYDRALSAHARYRPDYSEAVAFQAENTPETASPAPAKQPAAQSAEAFAQRTSALPRTSALEEKRMRASVTLRMSKAEFAQLQQRASEAGMTVSAYLRSCTFEVETLRAQVKQALAELRTARAETSQPPRASWLAQFFELMRICRSNHRPNHRPAVA